MGRECAISNYPVQIFKTSLQTRANNITQATNVPSVHQHQSVKSHFVSVNLFNCIDKHGLTTFFSASPICSSSISYESKPGWSISVMVFIELNCVLCFIVCLICVVKSLKSSCVPLLNPTLHEETFLSVCLFVFFIYY